MFGLTSSFHATIVERQTTTERKKNESRKNRLTRKLVPLCMHFFLFHSTAAKTRPQQAAIERYWLRIDSTVDTPLCIIRCRRPSILSLPHLIFRCCSTYSPCVDDRQTDAFSLTLPVTPCLAGAGRFQLISTEAYETGYHAKIDWATLTSFRSLSTPQSIERLYF